MRAPAILLAAALACCPLAADDLSGHCGAGWPLGPKPTVDAGDDDFDGAFTAPWVVTEGDAGTVDLLRRTSQPIEVYDLTTLPGVMLLQSGPNRHSAASPNQVTMYQDLTLADGQSVTWAIAASAGALENGTNFGVWLSNSTTSPYAAPTYSPYVSIQIDAETRQMYRMNSTANNAHLSQTQPDQTSNTEEIVLQRIVRQGLTYTLFWSNNWGLTWSNIGTVTEPVELTKLWIASQSFAYQSSLFTIPVHTILWICLGGNDYNPW